MPFGSLDDFNEEIAYRDVGIAQLSGDSRPDIIAVGAADDAPAGGARRFVQNGSGGFDPDAGRLSDVDLRALAIGPVDGDALDDVVVVGPTGAWVMLRQAGGGLATPQSVATSLNLTDVALGDVNGDGRTDILVAGATGARVLLQGAAGTFPSAAARRHPIATGVPRVDRRRPLRRQRHPRRRRIAPVGDEVLVRLGSARPAGSFTAAPGRRGQRQPGSARGGRPRSRRRDRPGRRPPDPAESDPRHPRPGDDLRRPRERRVLPRRDHPGPHRRAGVAGNDLRSIAVADLDADGLPDLSSPTSRSRRRSWPGIRR